MKKSMVGILSLCLGISVLTTSCTSYKEDKVYTQKEVKAYKENEQINKTEYITRNEAVKIANDIFKMDVYARLDLGTNFKESLKEEMALNLNKEDFKEEIVLNKDEKQNKFEWDVKWKTSSGEVNKSMTIDAITGDIKNFNEEIDSRTEYNKKYILTKEQIDTMIDSTLKMFKKDIKNYTFNYDYKIAGVVTVKDTGKVIKAYSQEESLKEGYGQTATFRLVNDIEVITISIDCKEMKVYGVNIQNKKDIGS